jgi:hypothetical protein
MRRTTFGILAMCAAAASSCGGGSKFANKPRPATPVNLTVYINNSRVSVSPSSVGAGPVIFIVTNAASRTETLTIQAPSGTQALGTTGPINPQATAQVTVDFTSPGDYTLGAGKTGGTQAAQSTPSSIQPAKLHIGHARPSASNALLQP